MKHYLHVGVDGVDDQDLTLQPYILFGSSFPKDKEYTQVCPILKGAINASMHVQNITHFVVTECDRWYSETCLYIHVLVIYHCIDHLSGCDKEVACYRLNIVGIIVCELF